MSRECGWCCNCRDTTTPSANNKEATAATIVARLRQVKRGIFIGAAIKYMAYSGNSRMNCPQVNAPTAKKNIANATEASVLSITSKDCIDRKKGWKPQAIRIASAG